MAKTERVTLPESELDVGWDKELGASRLLCAVTGPLGLRQVTHYFFSHTLQGPVLTFFSALN